VNVSQLKIKKDALKTLGALVEAANEKKAALIAANNAAIAAMEVWSRFYGKKIK